MLEATRLEVLRLFHQFYARLPGNPEDWRKLEDLLKFVEYGKAPN